MTAVACRKGVVFTFDALFAASIMLLVAAFFIYLPATETYSDMASARMSDNLLLALHKSGSLKSLNETLIEDDIAGYLPQGYSANLTLSIYNQSQDAAGSVGVSYPAVQPRQGNVFVVKKPFYINSTSTGMARLELWSS